MDVCVVRLIVEPLQRLFRGPGWAASPCQISRRSGGRRRSAGGRRGKILAERNIHGNRVSRFPIFWKLMPRIYRYRCLGGVSQNANYLSRYVFCFFLFFILIRVCVIRASVDLFSIPIGRYVFVSQLLQELSKTSLAGRSGVLFFLWCYIFGEIILKFVFLIGHPECV